jgi:heme-degrading monooxygenase HmoA
LTGGTNAIANIGAGINVNSGSHGTITITGNISGSASGALTNAGLSIQNGNAASAITINGDITAGAASHGLYIQTTAAVVTTVNGSVIGNARGTGSSDAVAYAVNVTSTQPITKVRAAKCGANGMWPISGPCFISNIHQGSVKVRNSLLNEGVYELPRPRSNGMGDYQIGDVIYRHYTFRTTPSSLTVAVYPDDSTEEITTGVTVTYSSGFDGVAGLVSIKVDTATGYTAGKDYSIVATGGTVYGDAVAGTVLGGFSLAKQTMQAVKTKTDNLPSDPADASDIASSFSTVNSTLSTIAGYIDTEVAAIKAKTDNLPSDPADASDIAAAFSTVNGTLSTIAGYVDTEISAIKTKTDNLPADTATVLTDLPKNVWNFDLLANIATTVNRYSPWNAMRHIVCKWSIASATKTVYKEDGTTAAYTTTVTSDATGITGDTP